MFTTRCLGWKDTCKNQISTRVNFRKNLTQKLSFFPRQEITDLLKNYPWILTKPDYAETITKNHNALWVTCKFSPKIKAHEHVWKFQNEEQIKELWNFLFVKLGLKGEIAREIMAGRNWKKVDVAALIGAYEAEQKNLKSKDRATNKDKKKAALLDLLERMEKRVQDAPW